MTSSSPSPELQNFVKDSRTCQTLVAYQEGYYKHRVLPNNEKVLSDLVAKSFSSELNDEQKKIVGSVVQKIRSENVDSNTEQLHYGVVYVFGFMHKTKEVFKYPLFKLWKTENSVVKYLVVDKDLKVYYSWDHFLETNDLPPSLLCLPSNGEYTITDVATGVIELEFLPSPSVTKKEKKWAKPLLVGLEVSLFAASIGFAAWGAPLLIARGGIALSRFGQIALRVIPLAVNGAASATARGVKHLYDKKQSLRSNMYKAEDIKIFTTRVYEVLRSFETRLPLAENTKVVIFAIGPVALELLNAYIKIRDGQFSLADASQMIDLLLSCLNVIVRSADGLKDMIIDFYQNRESLAQTVRPKFTDERNAQIARPVDTPEELYQAIWSKAYNSIKTASVKVDEFWDGFKKSFETSRWRELESDFLQYCASVWDKLKKKIVEFFRFLKSKRHRFYDKLLGCGEPENFDLFKIGQNSIETSIMEQTYTELGRVLKSGVESNEDDAGTVAVRTPRESEESSGFSDVDPTVEDRVLQDSMKLSRLVKAASFEDNMRVVMYVHHHYLSRSVSDDRTSTYCDDVVQPVREVDHEMKIDQGLDVSEEDFHKYWSSDCSLIFLREDETGYVCAFKYDSKNPLKCFDSVLAKICDSADYEIEEMDNFSCKVQSSSGNMKIVILVRNLETEMINEKVGFAYVFSPSTNCRNLSKKLALKNQ